MLTVAGNGTIPNFELKNSSWSTNMSTAAESTEVPVSSGGLELAPREGGTGVVAGSAAGAARAAGAAGGGGAADAAGAVGAAVEVAREARDTT